MQQTKKTAPFSAPLLLIILFVSLSGCGSENSNSQSNTMSPASSDAKVARFAVFSDPHLSDNVTLGGVDNGSMTSSDLASYIASQGKILVESSEILTSMINDLKSRELDFVMVTGDLTKEGELVNHRFMASKLAELKASGTKVYVIPGNHDINNPAAASDKTSTPSSVATISPAKFREIYADFSYGDAVASDPDPLSYVAEPVEGLWLLAIDSCQYDDNPGLTNPATGGKLKQATLSWILDQLKAAKIQGKTVIGMMHHSLLEHFAGQASIFPKYVIQDFESLSRTFSDNGLNVVFTGHFHAHDITMKNFGTSVLHDIETGALLNSPSPYRIIDLDTTNRTMAIKTSTVVAISSHATDFKVFSQKQLSDSLTAIPPIMLSDYILSPSQYLSLARYFPLIVDSMMAHYAGDEIPDEKIKATYTAMMGSLSPTTFLAGHFIASIWTDLPPEDKNVTIHINSMK